MEGYHFSIPKHVYLPSFQGLQGVLSVGRESRVLEIKKRFIHEKRNRPFCQLHWVPLALSGD